MSLLEREENRPFLIAKDGRKIPIRKVRIRVSAKLLKIAGGDHRRNAPNKYNHHLTIYAGKDKKGNPTWIEEVVSTLDAMHRKRENKPIIPKTDEKGNPLVFSFMTGEIVELEKDGTRGLFVFKATSEADHSFHPVNDARLKKEIWDSGANVRIRSMSAFQKAKPRKVHVGPLGEVRPAHD
jgi:hypothetical protein